MARGDHPIHSMSSYLGSFPPEIPRDIITRFVPGRAVVLDPFCGAGTTLVEAANRGHPSIGIDLNPLAVAISRAKTQRVRQPDVVWRVNELARGFGGDLGREDVSDDLRTIFHDRTLAQLVYLKGALDKENPEDVFLRGVLLGIMHGKFRRGGGSAYLSIDMPNTFSMSPGYVRSFVARNGLERPPVDVFDKLRQRVAWLLRDGAIPGRTRIQVVEGDAARLPSVLDGIGVRSVGAIVTSPPYLGVLRYGAFNWIRLWFLDHRASSVDKVLDGTDSLDGYLSFITSFLLAAAEGLKPGGIAALVIGDVLEHGVHVDLAPRVWEEVDGIVPFDLLEIRVDGYDTARKTTRIWGAHRMGRATPRDRVMILRRRAFRRARSVDRGRLTRQETKK